MQKYDTLSMMKKTVEQISDDFTMRGMFLHLL